jgi:hypothetical protein
MSIYATLWHLQFPRHGDASVGSDPGRPYVTVTSQFAFAGLATLR